MIISSIVRWSGRGGRGRNRKHHHPNDCRPQNCGLDKVLFREFHEERPLWSSIGSRMRLTHGTGLSQHLRKPQNLQRTPRISPHDFTSAVTRLCHLEIRLIGRNRTLSVSYTQREEAKLTYIHVQVVHFLHIFEVSYRHGGPGTRPAAPRGWQGQWAMATKSA